MYKLLIVEDTVRLPPKRFNEDLEETLMTEFENTMVGRIDREVGLILAATRVIEIGDGKIILGDGAIYYNTVLEIIVYEPVLNEVVEGTVTEITEFGAFVNFGPMDGLVHVSQVTEDFMGYDQKNSNLVGKESKKVLKLSDYVRARIVSVSLKPRFSDSKIGLTMRQPYLGKKEWLEDEKKAQKEKEKKKTKPKKEKKEKKK
ncbi:MAG: DNA-directed RNA polymerase [Candidatus Altiarchaeales archaeon]|nr:DNA-directed RNA polymerase [Candidatus Altiarchaeota archaeon]MBU4341917.1 DNA-directed RNA polymerase [Candidatus Altiarchaeota archaeon]MBU4406897.1 DNA-directed RNA polymerase [Candidatus Altiarchaeota archaeon]MBU4437737.1 DNA-directed RNA polymerase [Candidatus Altiarchaeota archaeon]MCG2783089.1 DNA-directed RNA polymerase [Candidatus Altiarchaeales archaeon]